MHAAWDSVIDKYVNGACTQTKTQDIMQNQCVLVDVIDPTSETGYRKVQQCQLVKIGEQDVCTAWDQVPVYKDVCKKYAKKDVYEKHCTTWENQKTGTTQVCVQTKKEDIFQDVCKTQVDALVGKKCIATDPNWVCPPAIIVSDGVTRELLQREAVLSDAETQAMRRASELADRLLAQAITTKLRRSPDGRA